MLYELFTLLIRPLRRWWRRVVVAAIVATVVVPVGRAYLDDVTSGQQDTIVIPPISHD